MLSAENSKEYMSKFEGYDYAADGCRLRTFGVLFEADCPEEAVRKYKQGNVTFWRSWRGSFCGILQDTEKNITLLFNDHIGSKTVFYTQTEQGLAWGTSVYDLARETGTTSLNGNYLWQMLIYGYSPTGETVYTDIQRLQAGEYIYASGNHIEKRIYHRFDNTPNHLSIEENIERIDAAFRKAVERAIRKNEEYGYTHFLPLSAGLDSRMTNRVAHELARTPIHNITYSQTGYYDETTPRELADYWHNEMHFTPLDGGDCLMHLDEVSRMTNGLIHYSGAAETLYGLPEDAKARGGVFLTGMVGDIIVGTAFTSPDPTQMYHIGEGSIIHGHSEILQRVLPIGFEHIYPNREIYYLYVRGFNCADLGSPLIHQQFGESYSPFCDVDVLEAAYAAPLEQRWNYRLYDRWILTKYPDMARWLHNGVDTIGHRHKRISLMGRSMTVTDLPKRIGWYILKHLHIHDFYQETEGKSMSPEDTWFAQNEPLQKWSESYIRSNIALLDSFPEVQKTALRFSRGNATERMQVLSLLACLRQTR